MNGAKVYLLALPFSLSHEQNKRNTNQKHDSQLKENIHIR